MKTVVTGAPSKVTTCLICLVLERKSFFSVKPRNGILIGDLGSVLLNLEKALGRNRDWFYC